MQEKTLCFSILLPSYSMHNLPRSTAIKDGKKVFLSEPGQERSRGLSNPNCKHENFCTAPQAFHSSILFTSSILNSIPVSLL